MARAQFLGIVLVTSLGIAAFVHKTQTVITPVTDPKIEIDTVFDATGIPDHYKAHISTPICEADKCYAVEIIFCWDLIGPFMS